MLGDRRLRRRAEFEYVRSRGRRVSNALMILGFARSGDGHTRFGLSVSRRVGGAIVRNGVKRRLRESIRSLRFRDGWSVTVTARPGAAKADYRALRSSVETLARRAGLLGETDAHGEWG